MNDKSQFSVINDIMNNKMDNNIPPPGVSDSFVHKLDGLLVKSDARV